ncbi:hypothetical protein BJ166DRAFT_88806 [Pestalotiopsis sp. NC0098]|nr:hypothetical protein BJ166DRAFT_88806 [Pestalotiopsis sp. NC0098]
MAVTLTGMTRSLHFYVHYSTHYSVPYPILSSMLHFQGSRLRLGLNNGSCSGLSRGVVGPSPGPRSPTTYAHQVDIVVEFVGHWSAARLCGACPPVYDAFKRTVFGSSIPCTTSFPGAYISIWFVWVGSRGSTRPTREREGDMGTLDMPGR